MIKQIECEKCGWKWNTKDSKEHDKYVCHKCDHDNSNIYKSLKEGNTKMIKLIDLIKENLNKELFDTKKNKMKLSELRKLIHEKGEKITTSKTTVKKQNLKEITEIIRQEIHSAPKESKNSDSLKSILRILKIGKFFGIFNDNFFKEIQEAVTKKVETSLDAYKTKIPSDKMEDYNSLVKDLLLPLKNAKTFEEFILVANNISKYSNKIKIDESIDLKSTIATLEKDLKAIVKDVKGLWNKTKENRIFLSIVTILARILLMTFFGVIHELLRLNQGTSW
jgi:NAD-dependent SIR2 family protein deacetylase